MACVYSIDNGKTFMLENDFKSHLLSNINEYVKDGVLELSKFRSAKGSIEEPTDMRPLDKASLVKVLQVTFGYKPKFAKLQAELFDIRAKVWAKATGKTKEDYYNRFSFTNQSEKEGLNQVEAYHGSPHNFDKFTTEKIGTGEGNQAFGWGLYFTELKSIAKTYANMQMPYSGKFLFNGEVPNNFIKVDMDYLERTDYPLELDNVKDALIGYYETEIEDSESDLDSFEKNTTGYNEIKSKIDGLKSNLEFIKNADITKNNSKKAIYNVSLHEGKTPEQYTWLEWDKPISNKTKQVILSNQESLKKSINESKYVTGKESVSERNEILKEVKDEIIKDLINSSDVKVFYGRLSSILGGDKKASLFLLENGIDGIKYPAESVSRGATSDNARGFNYVVFDENAVTIKEKELFQKANLGTHGQITFGDKINGFYNAVISIFNNKRPDTFIHEFSHANLQDIISLAQLGDETAIKDLITSIEFYNANSKEKLDVNKTLDELLNLDVSKDIMSDAYVKVQENFANGFVKYVSDSESKNIPEKIKAIYDKMLEFLKEVMNIAMVSDIHITPEMEQVFGRLFGEQYVELQKENKAAYDLQHDAIPKRKISEAKRKNALNNFNTLNSADEEYTVTDVLKDVINDLLEEGKTDKSIIVEQLKEYVAKNVEDANKVKQLNDFIDANKEVWKTEAGTIITKGTTEFRRQADNFLANPDVPLSTKEKLIKNQTWSTYIVSSFKNTEAWMVETMGGMDYDAILENYYPLMSAIDASTLNKGDKEYAKNYLIGQKLSQGYAKLKTLEKDYDKNANEIEQLHNELDSQLVEVITSSTEIGKALAALKAFQSITPRQKVDAIDRIAKEERDPAKVAELQTKIDAIKEKLKNGEAKQEIADRVIKDLEDENVRKAKLIEQLQEEKKKLQEAKKKEKNIVREAKAKITTNKITIPKSDADKVLKSALDSLSKIKSLFSMEAAPESKEAVFSNAVTELILYHQLNNPNKQTTLKDIEKILKDNKYNFSLEDIATAYKTAGESAIAQGVREAAIQTEAEINAWVEGRVSEERIKELEKEKEKNDTSKEKNQNRIIREALGLSTVTSKKTTPTEKPYNWKEAVSNLNQADLIKEMIAKVKEQNPQLSNEDLVNIEKRLQDLFKEKTQRWVQNELHKIESKNNSKPKKPINNNIKRIANIIASGEFKTDVGELMMTELGYGGLTELQKDALEQMISQLQQLELPLLRNKLASQISAYVSSIVNPKAFFFNFLRGKAYVAMLAGVVTSSINMTSAFAYNLDSAIRLSIKNKDASYFLDLIQAFNKGAVRSAVSKKLFTTNENFEEAKGEFGLAPYNAIQYAEYIKNLDGATRRSALKYMNFMAKYGLEKFQSFVQEGSDAINYLAALNMAAKDYATHLVLKENKGISKTDLRKKVDKLLNPISDKEAMEIAMKDLNTMYGEVKHSNALIKRAFTDAKYHALDPKIRFVAEAQALEATFKGQLKGFANGGGAMQSIGWFTNNIFEVMKSFAKNPKTSKSKNQSVINAIDFVKLNTIPFVKAVMHIMEIGTHYAGYGALVKVPALMVNKARHKQDWNPEKQYLHEVERNKVLARVVKGSILSAILVAAFMQHLDDNDDELAIYGDARVNGKNRNTLKIGNKSIALYLTAQMQPLFSMLASYFDVVRDNKLRKINEEAGREESEILMSNYQKSLTNWTSTLWASVPAYGGINPLFHDDLDKVAGKKIGNLIALTGLGAKRNFEDAMMFFNHDQNKPTSFPEQIVAGVGNYILPMYKSRHDLDYKGEPIDIRQSRPSSLSGLVYNFNSTGDSDTDKKLRQHNYIPKQERIENYDFVPMPNIDLNDLYKERDILKTKLEVSSVADKSFKEKRLAELNDEIKEEQSTLSKEEPDNETFQDFVDKISITYGDVLKLKGNRTKEIIDFNGKEVKLYGLDNIIDSNTIAINESVKIENGESDLAFKKRKQALIDKGINQDINKQYNAIVSYYLMESNLYKKSWNNNIGLTETQKKKYEKIKKEQKK